MKFAWTVSTNDGAYFQGIFRQIPSPLHFFFFFLLLNFNSMKREQYKRRSMHLLNMQSTNWTYYYAPLVICRLYWGGQCSVRRSSVWSHPQAQCKHSVRHENCLRASHRIVIPYILRASSILSWPQVGAARCIDSNR